MPYGQGGRLGDTINPALMMADYGGFANAGMIKGQMFQNAGEQIGETLKLRGNQDKFIKTQIQAANAIKKALPDVGPLVDDALVKLNDPEASHRDRLAMAESIQESLKIGLLGMDQQRADEQMMLERMKLAASMQGGAQSMRVTPEQLNQMRDSGAKVTVENMLPDGSYVVKTAVWGEQPLVNIGGGVDANGNIIPGGQARPSSAIPNFGYGAAGSIPSPEGVVPQEILPGMEGDPMSWQRPDAAAGINSAIGVAIDGSPGVLNPRPAGVPAPQSPLASYFNSGTPAKGDVYQVDAQGRPIGVVREPGSTPEIEYRLKEQQLQKGAAETEKARAEHAAAQQKAAGMEEQKARTAEVLVQDSYRLLDDLKKTFSGDGAASATARLAASKMPGTNAYNAAAKIETIKSNITISTLQEMRQNSPTGGALGSVTEREGDKLAAIVGSFDLKQDIKALESNTNRLIERTLDTVHGTQQQREKLLKDGKITPEQNAEVEAMYPSTTMDIRGNVVPRKPMKGFEPKPTTYQFSPMTQEFLNSLNVK